MIVIILIEIFDFGMLKVVLIVPMTIMIVVILFTIMTQKTIIHIK